MSPEATPCEGGQQLGRVGSEIILAGNLFGGIYDLMEQILGKKLPPEKLEAQRQQLAAEIKEAVNDLAAHSNEPNPLAHVAPEHRRWCRIF